MSPLADSLLRRWLPGLLILGASVVSFTGCQTGKSIDLTKERDSEPDRTVRREERKEIETSVDTRESKPFVQVNPNVVIGQIVWVNPADGTGVLRLDNAYPVEQRFLVAVSPSREPVAVIETLGGLQGRSIGFRIADGAATAGVDVLLPSRQWALQLRDQYAPPRNPEAEGSPAAAGPAPAPEGEISGR